MVKPSFTSDNFYAIYDIAGIDLKDAPDTDALGVFNFMAGGDMTISTISYDVMDLHGFVTTKFIPGQISFSPISLSRPLDNISQKLYEWFFQAEWGLMSELRKNYSLAKINRLGDFEVIWDLINVIPVAVPGFSYNSVRGSASTKFKLKLQAENIDIVWMYG